MSKVKNIKDYFNDKPYYIECADYMKVLCNIPDNSLDLILTDPPYNFGLFMKNRATNLKAMRPNFLDSADWDSLEFDKWKQSMDNLFAECAKTSKDCAFMIMFTFIIKVETIIQLASRHGLYYKTTGI